MSRPTPAAAKTRSWPAYNVAMKRRGALTIWFDPAMIWEAEPTGKRGRQPDHSDATIQTCLIMKVRQAGFGQYAGLVAGRGDGKAFVVWKLINDDTMSRTGATGSFVQQSDGTKKSSPPSENALRNPGSAAWPAVLVICPRNPLASASGTSCRLARLQNAILRSNARVDTMGIIWTIIIGFVAGVIAKFLHPGEKEPSGFILTALLGIIGAFVASWMGQALGLYGPNEGAGLIGAVLGAIVILLVWSLATKNRA